MTISQKMKGVLDLYGCVAEVDKGNSSVVGVKTKATL